MTCIVGVIDGENVVIGGDSALSTKSGDLLISSDPKVFRVGEFLVAWSGSPRYRDIVARNFKPITYNPKRHGSPTNFVGGVWADGLRDVLREHGALHGGNGKPECMDSEMLIGFRGKLYLLDEFFAVHTPKELWYATGSGGQVANGAMYALYLQWVLGEAESRVTTALEAAEKYNTGVRGPFTVLTLTPEDCRTTSRKPRKKRRELKRVEETSVEGEVPVG